MLWWPRRARPHASESPCPATGWRGSGASRGSVLFLSRTAGPGAEKHGSTPSGFIRLPCQPGMCTPALRNRSRSVPGARPEGAPRCVRSIRAVISGTATPGLLPRDLGSPQTYPWPLQIRHGPLYRQGPRFNIRVPPMQTQEFSLPEAGVESRVNGQVVIRRLSGGQEHFIRGQGRGGSELWRGYAGRRGCGPAIPRRL